MSRVQEISICTLVLFCTSVVCPLLLLLRPSPTSRLLPELVRLPRSSTSEFPEEIRELRQARSPPLGNAVGGGGRDVCGVGVDARVVEVLDGAVHLGAGRVAAAVTAQAAADNVLIIGRERYHREREITERERENGEGRERERENGEGREGERVRKNLFSVAQNAGVERAGVIEKGRLLLRLP